MQSAATTYASEVRDYLLGRLETHHADDAAAAQESLLPRRYLSWWLFEAKRYAGLEGPLARQWTSVARQVRRLRAAHSPRRKDVLSPEGEMDWLGSALASVTSGGRRYVARTSGLGLADDERDALEGWLGWLGEAWSMYVSNLGLLPGVADELPTELLVGAPVAATIQRLRRWAHTARRSRWPLLRNIVAEMLRVTLEPQEIDRLPLPTEHSRLFQLVCLVRALRTIAPTDRQLRWLDLEAGGNTVRVGGVTCHFETSLSEESVRASAAYPDELVCALIRHGLPLSRRVDLLFKLEPALHGFASLLVECKSGETQKPKDALEQMRLYRAVLRDRFPEPMLVLGVVEAGPVATSAVQGALRGELVAPARHDAYVFCSGDELPAVLAAAGLMYKAPAAARAA